MKRTAIGLALFGVFLIAIPAMAQANTIEIFIGEGLVKGEPGDVVRIHSETVDPNMVGWTCTGSATTGNNASEHSLNDFVLTSGGSSAVIPDWEAEAGATTSMSGTLVLGPTITIDLVLGTDGRASGGVLIALNCAQPEPTTTTTVAATTTTDPVDPTTTTTAAAVTTTAPPAVETEEGETPVGGPTAGGGSTAGGNGLGLLTLALGATAIFGAGALAMMSRSRGTREE